MTAGSRDYGLTLGSRDTPKIELTELGREAVYPAGPEESQNSLQRAFFSVEKFRDVFQYYGGNTLPEPEYLYNTLQTEFDLDPRIHGEFVDVFQKNCRFLSLYSTDQASAHSGNGIAADSPEISRIPPEGPTVTIRRSEGESDLLCFVIMPFTERDETHDVGFFNEVLKSLVAPSASSAGFNVRSARRLGSDVIQKTIINDLLTADLVVADLTEHNPNVMFELGMRMAYDLPVALIRAKGTGPIFDVDNMLRVYDYDGRMWPTTIEKDLPNLEGHIKATWDSRASGDSYINLLGRQAAQPV